MRNAKWILVFLVVTLVLSGCGSRGKVPEVGDFSFELPEGFTISDVTDMTCTVRDGEGTVVSTIRLTDITPSQLWDDDDGALPRYFNKVAYGCEYFGWTGGDEAHPLHYITLYFPDPDTLERRESYRVLFVKDGGVYDMWLDKEKLDADTITAFEAVAERQGEEG